MQFGAQPQHLPIHRGFANGPAIVRWHCLRIRPPTAVAAFFLIAFPAGRLACKHFRRWICLLADVCVFCLRTSGVRQLAGVCVFFIAWRIAKWQMFVRCHFLMCSAVCETAWGFNRGCLASKSATLLAPPARVKMKRGGGGGIRSIDQKRRKKRRPLHYRPAHPHPIFEGALCQRSS